jgi:hypothetical protein
VHTWQAGGKQTRQIPLCTFASETMTPKTLAHAPVPAVPVGAYTVSRRVSEDGPCLDGSRLSIWAWAGLSSFVARADVLHNKRTNRAGRPFSFPGFCSV